MKKAILLLVAVIALSGCSLLKLPGLPTPKGPQTVYNWQETITRKPHTVIVNGKIVVVEEVTQELIVGYEKVTPKRTFIQKIGAWISGLGILGFVLLAIGLVLAPATTIGFLIGTIKKWKSAMKETVVAIKDSGAVKEGNGLKTALSEKQSTQTKALVDSIKRAV